MTHVSRWLALALLVTSLAGIPGGGAAQVGTVVCIQPAGGTYPLDSDIPVQLRVEDVEGLYGVDVQLSFDPSRLVVVEPQVVPAYDLLWPDMIVINEVDNVAGTIRYVAVQLARPPANGSGALFSFTFHTLGAGPATAGITMADLSDIDGVLIDRATENACYWLGGWLGDRQVFLPLILRSH